MGDRVIRYVDEYEKDKDELCVKCKGNNCLFSPMGGEWICHGFVPCTNADRIRAMSDEELADFLYVKTCEDGYPAFDTVGQWLAWLRQGVEE